MVNEWLLILVLLPVFAFLASIFLPPKNERLIAGFTSAVMGIHVTLLLSFLVYWFSLGHPTLDQKDWVLFRSQSYEFFIDFCFDKITAVYALVGSFLTFIVSAYSKIYLHREPGYKRFFQTLLFFYCGYAITIFSGNMETLFVGWEILGISSFLLIAFYRDRFLPVKNALKVFSIYRIGDIGLILCMWMTHHLFHENITFLKLSNYEQVSDQLQQDSLNGIFISLMILLTAAAKSAQFPFSAWLPRAMEGPTPSSAIFYGSLAVHLGSFLLIRTYPFWEHQLSVLIVIGCLGVLTAIMASLTARVQSNIKSQIAYASIAQIGLMFLELSLGWKNIALFHFAGNAFLRTYQLLVSPSVVSYLIREMFYRFEPTPNRYKKVVAKKFLYSLYVMSLKEWNLNNMMYVLYWNPIKWLGRQFKFLTLKHVLYFFVPLYVLGVLARYYLPHLHGTFIYYLPIVFSFIGLVMVLKAFTERSKARVSWVLVILNHFWVALAISFNEDFKFVETLFYLSGIVGAGALGYYLIHRMALLEENIDLTRFNGHVHKHPKMALLFLLCCLGLSGFPISPTFIGEDLVFSHIHPHQLMLAVFVSASFIMDGLSILRIYARVFMGPHVHSVYEMGYRSS